MKKSVGLGLRHTFHDYVLTHKPRVPWFEVITENYLYFGGRPRKFLSEVRKDYPLVFHGVSLSIGSLEPLRLSYLHELKKMISEFQPLWVSDHLCWTFNGPENSHDLLPVPLTKESLQRITEKISQAQDILGQKIYLENPSAYVDFAANQYTEQDFIKELCTRSGCGLLLDLNNLIVNKYNLGYQPLDYLKTLKNCDVRQIHLAGHTIKEKVRIDTHDTEINEEALALLPVAKKYWPDVNPMIEWDDKIPPIEYLLSERERIQNLFEQGGDFKVDSNVNAVTTGNLKEITNSFSMSQFWKLIKQEALVSEADIKAAEILRTDLPTPAAVGMNVYNSAYVSRLLEVFEKDFPVLKVVLNELFEDVILDYLKKYPSTYESIDFIGQNLAKFIKENSFSYNLGVDKKIIADVAAFESFSGLAFMATEENHNPLDVKKFTEEDWAEKKLKLKSFVKLYESDCLMHSVIHSVNAQQIPEVPMLTKSYYMFYRDDESSYYRVLSKAEFMFLSHFNEFKTFYSFVEDKEDQLESYAKILFENEKFFCQDHG